MNGGIEEMGKSITKFDDYMSCLKKEANKINNPLLFTDADE